MAVEKHQFAVYVAGLVAFKFFNGRCKITDPDLVHRISKVLRLEIGEELVLFDQYKAITCQVVEVGRKEIVLELLLEQVHKLFKHRVIMALAVLKKEHFEQALYSCVELGATEIWPIMFQKSGPLHLNAQRLQTILVSAAEQSKNFNLPICAAPISGLDFFNLISSDPKSTYILCDVAGQPLLDHLQNLKMTCPNQVVLVVGPEGDLTSSEKSAMQANGAKLMQLTPTVLRSVQATAVCLGAVRSVLK